MADDDDARAAPELGDAQLGIADWDTVLDRWAAEIDGRGWVTVAEAEAATGVSRSALRAWYRKGEVPSRVHEGPHGPQRLLPLDAVLERVARSPRLGRRRPTAAGATTEGAGVQALVDLLAAQIERAEARAEQAEVALRAALARAAAAEAERDVLRRQAAPPTHPDR